MSVQSKCVCLIDGSDSRRNCTPALLGGDTRILLIPVTGMRLSPHRFLSYRIDITFREHGTEFLGMF